MAFIVISLSHLLGCRFLFVWNGRSVPESTVVRLSNKEWVLEYWYECSVFLLLLLLLSFPSLLFFLSVAIFLQHLRDNFLFSILEKKLWFKHSDFFLFPRPPPYDYPSEDPIGVSTYKANFRETNFPRQGPHPTSPLRKNNPHPKTMTNAFNYPNRVSFSLGETEDFFFLGWGEGNHMVFRGEGWRNSRSQQSRGTTLENWLQINYQLGEGDH